jgi:hypothetical protein
MPPTTPKPENLYQNKAEMSLQDGTRSDELTGGAIRQIAFNNGGIEFHITKRPMHTGIGAPVTSETLYGAATKALTAAKVKFTPGHDVMDPSFIDVVRLDSSNFDIIAAADVMLGGITKHLSDKKVTPKSGAKDHPDRFTAEAAQIREDSAVRAFLLRDDIRPKVGKATLDAIQNKSTEATAPSGAEAKPKVADRRVAEAALKKATGLEFRHAPHEYVAGQRGGSYAIVLQHAEDAKKLVRDITFGTHKIVNTADVHTRYAAMTEGGGRGKEVRGTMVMIRAEAVTEDVVTKINRGPRSAAATLRPPPTVTGIV